MNNTEQLYTKDTIVNTIIESFIKRSNIGFEKYGTTLDRKDLNLLDWIQHAQEEHMDAILYLEKLKQQYMEEKMLKTNNQETNTNTNDNIPDLWRI